MQSTKISLTVDARDLTCPMPLLKAKQGLNNVAERELICVLATDVNSTKDIANFVSLTRHELVEQTESDGVFKFLIRKGCSDK
ncbi:Sulfurtransferase TusA [Thalassocella blandensis]|nr:Sulfurtransferase TusA [Thalassocella blandensis]